MGQFDQFVGALFGSSGSTGSGRQRIGGSGEAVVGDAHGRYYEAAMRNVLFSASNVAAQAVSAALTTTYTGLCISNPLGSGKNLSMIGCNWAHSAAPTTVASIHLIAGYSATANVTHGTPLASPGIQSALIGQAGASIAKADSAATTVNPYYLIPLGSAFTSNTLYGMSLAWIDLAGQFLVPPGGWIAIGALTAITGFGGFTWEEVPILT